VVSHKEKPPSLSCAQFCPTGVAWSGVAGAVLVTAGRAAAAATGEVVEVVAAVWVTSGLKRGTSRVMTAAISSGAGGGRVSTSGEPTTRRSGDSADSGERRPEGEREGLG